MRFAAVLLSLVLAACSSVLSACSSPPEPPPEPISCASGTAAGQGSSAQTSVLQTWIKAYQIACPDATIAYAGIGSSAGVRAFLDGTGDFAGTDSALSEEDLRRAGQRCGGPVVHLPLVAGPIALAYNVAGVDDLRLAPGSVARILTGRITTWNHPDIRRDNPGVTLPATPIRPVVPGGSSIPAGATATGHMLPDSSRSAVLPANSRCCGASLPEPTAIS